MTESPDTLPPHLDPERRAAEHDAYVRWTITSLMEDECPAELDGEAVNA